MNRTRRAPPLVTALVLLALGLAVAWGMGRDGRVASARALPAPPGAAVLRVMALGEPAVLARVLMLWLQTFDYQPGVSLAFRDLDYARVEAWLDRMLSLDPEFQYPLLAASRLYAEVPDEARARRMLRLVERRFAEDPAGRWRWMAHAVLVAKHRLDDPRLALELARELAEAPGGTAIPGWARQMRIFVLEDLGELEGAKILLGGLLESGAVDDPRERAFLSRRLAALEERAAAEAAGGVPPPRRAAPEPQTDEISTP